MFEKRLLRLRRIKKAVLAAAMLLFVINVHKASAQDAPKGFLDVPHSGFLTSRTDRCAPRGNSLLDPQKIIEIRKREMCGEFLGDRDLNAHSYIGYTMRGDCRISGHVEVFRSDSERIFLVRLTNIWGGCRAGGSISGIIETDKIPDDFSVKFEEVRIDQR